MTSIFAEIGITVSVATAMALVARFFKQPPLVGYILTGVTLGPLGAHFLGNEELFEAMRQIGTALLLFMVGLELDWTKAKNQIKNIAWLVLLQVLVSLVAGFWLSSLIKLPPLTGLYLGLALSFSSTVIVVKLLSESRDLESLHGRIAIGVLLIQDLVAIFALTIVSGLAMPSALSIYKVLFLLVVKMSAILALIWILSNYILPPLFAKIAKSQELLFLSSLAWCFALAIVLSYYNLPLEIGAFLAGVSLASLPYSLDMVSRLKSLRDFFVIMLFVTIGSTLAIPDRFHFSLAIWLVVLTVVAKPIFATVAMLLKGYKGRTAFMTGLSQSQFSEFALILAVMGLKYGQLSEGIVSAITFAAVFSILIATVIFTHRLSIYLTLHNIFHWIEHKVKNHPVEVVDDSYHDHIIIFGYHRMGYHILKKLRDLKHKVVIVDFNPDIIKRLKEQQIDCVYGDVQDEDVLDAVGAKDAKMIISTIPHREETAFLIDVIRRLHKQTTLIVTAHHIDDALSYYQRGASYVILPHLLGGEHIADLITQYENHDLKNVLKHRAEEIKLLRTRNHVLYYD